MRVGMKPTWSRRPEQSVVMAAENASRLLRWWIDLFKDDLTETELLFWRNVKADLDAAATRMENGR